MRASEPGASAVAEEVGGTNSPTLPLIAETTPATGAMRTVFWRSRWAMATAACRLRTWAAWAAMSYGRSVLAAFSWFCAVTTLCWAFSIDTSPAAASTCCLFSAASSAVFFITTLFCAVVTADSCAEQSGGGELTAVALRTGTPFCCWHCCKASSASSSCFLAKLSSDSARSTADALAEFVAATWSSVASRICSACARVASAPPTAVAFLTLPSMATCCASWACCWASIWLAT